MVNRTTSMIAIALLGYAGFSTSVLAQDKAAPSADADKTQVAPDKKDLKPYPATVEKMDDNAQRMHDRDSAASPQASPTKPQANANADQQAGASQADVRNWDSVDKNNDNLISPEEMEAELKPTGTQPSNAK